MLEAFYKAIKTQLSKAQDYNKGSVDYPDYFIFGRKSAAQFLYSKDLRLVSLAQVEGEGPIHETLDDTYIDIMVYAAFAHAIRAMSEKSPERNPDTTGPAPTSPVVEGRRGPRQLGIYDT